MGSVKVFMGPTGKSNRNVNNRKTIQPNVRMIYLISSKCMDILLYNEDKPSFDLDLFAITTTVEASLIALSRLTSL